MKISLTEDNNRANTRAYILAIRSRLTDLGYLQDSEQNRSSETIDPSLKNAVKKFQKDAGLKHRDSWVGPKTWQVLQQLVSFEDQQDPYSWTIFKK
jgi:murein L,D-transpeptidase YcbB/YkuD